jgi:CheY-like chemotaxis protein
VELMGGTIWLRSQPHQGTSFFFTIETKAGSESLNEDQVANKNLVLRDHQVGLVGKPQGAMNQVYHKLLGFGLKPVFISDKIHTVKTSELSLIIVDAGQLRKSDTIQTIAQSLDFEPLMLMGYSTEQKDVQQNLARSPDYNLNKPVKQDELFKLLNHSLSDTTGSRHEVSNASTSGISPTLAKELPLTILVAEDNLINQKLITRVLEKMGYKPDVAANGDEVIKALNQKSYDLILMDIQMPEKDGIEATKIIRGQQLHQPAIIALTAAAQEADQDRCLKAGMNDFISKPMDFEKLEALIRKWGYSIQD